MALKPKGTYLTPEQTKLLKIKLLENCTSARQLAPLIPISVSSFCNRLNGRDDFRQPEIARVCELLGIPFAEIPKYFFDEKLSNANF